MFEDWVYDTEIWVVVCGRYGKIFLGMKIVSSTSRDGHSWMACNLRMS